MYTFSVIDGDGKRFKKMTHFTCNRQKLNYEVNINMIPLDCPPYQNYCIRHCSLCKFSCILTI